MNGDVFWKIDAPKVNCAKEFWQRVKDKETSDLQFWPDALSGPKTIESREFKRVSFSKTIISKINFKKCSFEDCQFIGAEFRKCEFHDCTFINCNTWKIVIKQSYIDPTSFENCLDKNIHENIGTHLYHQLTRNSRDEDQPEFERRAYFKFKNGSYTKNFTKGRM